MQQKIKVLNGWLILTGFVTCYFFFLLFLFATIKILKHCFFKDVQNPFKLSNMIGIFKRTRDLKTRPPSINKNPNDDNNENNQRQQQPQQQPLQEQPQSSDNSSSTQSTNSRNIENWRLYPQLENLNAQPKQQTNPNNINDQSLLSSRLENIIDSEEPSTSSKAPKEKKKDENYQNDVRKKPETPKIPIEVKTTLKPPTTTSQQPHTKTAKYTPKLPKGIQLVLKYDKDVTKATLDEPKVFDHEIKIDERYIKCFKKLKNFDCNFNVGKEYVEDFVKHFDNEKAYKEKIEPLGVANTFRLICAAAKKHCFLTKGMLKHFEFEGYYQKTSETSDYYIRRIHKEKKKVIRQIMAKIKNEKAVAFWRCMSKYLVMPADKRAQQFQLDDYKCKPMSLLELDDLVKKRQYEKVTNDMLKELIGQKRKILLENLATYTEQTVETVKECFKGKYLDGMNYRLIDKLWAAYKFGQTFHKSMITDKDNIAGKEEPLTLICAAFLLEFGLDDIK